MPEVELLRHAQLQQQVGAARVVHQRGLVVLGRDLMVARAAVRLRCTRAAATPTNTVHVSLA